MKRNPEYPCPACEEYVEILPTTPESFECPWCSEPLRLSTDAEFENGAWHDLSHLYSTRKDMENIVAHSQKVEECDHKYAERTGPPAGVVCIHCGHFVGAWET